MFVSGHPGRTNRLNTVAELEYLRDTGYPYLLQRLNRLEVLLGAVERAQRARTASGPRRSCFGVQNSRKARIGGLGRAARPEAHGPQGGRGEAAARVHRARRVGSRTPRPRPGRSRRSPKAEKVRAELIRDDHRAENAGRVQLRTCSASPAPWSAPPRSCPSRPASGSASSATPGSPSLKFQLFSDEPIYDDFETLKLADALHVPGRPARAGQRRW